MAKRGSGRSVLVVEFDPRVRERIGRWLEDSGFQVMGCPGPSAPNFGCVGVQGSGCALAHGADLIVLDLWLESDHNLLGASSGQILAYYTRSGLPVVAFSHRPSDQRRALRYVEDRVVWVEWPPERRELVETVRAELGAPAS